MAQNSGKVFFLYNEREERIKEIANLFSGHDVPYYYWRRDIKYGTDFDEKENIEFENALIFLVFLGRYGWGPQHGPLTERAMTTGKVILPVLIGDPPDEAFSQTNKLFASRRYFDLRTNDENASFELLQVVKESLNDSSEGVKKNREEKSHNLSECEEILRIVSSGTTVQYNTVLDKIRNSSWINREILSSLIRNKLLTSSSNGNGNNEHVDVRLLRALALTDAESEENRKCLEDRLKPGSSSYIQYSTLTTLYEANATYLNWAVNRYTSSADASRRVHQLAELIRDPNDSWAVEDLGREITNLSSNYPEALETLIAVPSPKLVPAICFLLNHPDHNTVSLSLMALSNPNIAPIAAKHLKETTAVEPFLNRVIDACARDAESWDLARYCAVLFNEFDQPLVNKVLEERLEVDETRRGAQSLLNYLLNLRRIKKSQFVAGYDSDTVDIENDPLDISEDVQTLTSVMLARNVTPPLAIGLFGDWGSGKSYFIESMKQAAKDLSEKNRAVPDSPFCTSIVSVHFNAWYYVDTNLWASLVSKIFDELANHVCPQPTPEEKQAAFLSELKSAKSVMDEVIQEKQRTQEKIKRENIRLQKLQKLREQREISLRELRAEDLKTLLTDEQKKDLDATLNRLGLPTAMKGLTDLTRVVAEANTIRGRMSSLFFSIINTKNRTATLLLLLVVLVLIPVGVWAMQKYLDLDRMMTVATAFITEFIVGLTAVTAILRRGLKYTNEGLDTISEYKMKIDKIIADKRKTPSKEEVRIQKKIALLTGEEQESVAKLSAASAHVLELEQRIQTLNQEYSLSNFLLERTKSDDYRKHMGLISTIRRDFDDLQIRLKKALDEKDPKFKHVERIILYIDDLDRCPADKVMEVLQAIHLILAYRLFVVVVGVDPRWLLHSLKKTYSAFEGSDRLTDEEPDVWQATPQNYLEKIFQIPFSLRPMTDEGYQKLVHGLFSPEEGTQLKMLQNKINVESLQVKPHKTEVRVDRTDVAPEMSDAQIVHGTGRPSVLPSTENQQLKSAIQSGTLPFSSTQDVNPDSLQIKYWETKFAQSLFELVPTPRAAKRFTNTYRILKAPVKPQYLSDFEGTEDMPGKFRVPMLLLAILIGAPAEAIHLFPKLQQHVLSEESAVEALKNLQLLKLRGAAYKDLQNKIEPIISSSTFPASSKLFAYWIPRVSRFSFDLGKVIRSDDSEKEKGQKNEGVTPEEFRKTINQ